MTAAPLLPPGIEWRVADVNGSRLSYLDGGAGPLVVLLHGWPETSLSWLPMLGPLLREGYRVAAPDLRGTGESERATDGYGKDDQAEDLRQLLDHLGAAEPIRLVGHDIGAMVAFSFARLHPERVARLVLVDVAVPGLGLEQAMDVAQGGRWHFGLFMQPELPAILITGHEQEFLRWWFADQAARPDRPDSDAVAGYIRAYSGRDALDAGFGHYRTLLADGKVNKDWAAAGGTLQMAVLAVGGEHSAGQQLATALQRVAPRTQGAVVRGTGHFVAEEQPKEFWAVLQPFLADT